MSKTMTKKMMLKMTMKMVTRKIIEISLGVCDFLVNEGESTKLDKRCGIANDMELPAVLNIFSFPEFLTWDF